MSDMDPELEAEMREAEERVKLASIKAAGQIVSSMELADRDELYETTFHAVENHECSNSHELCMKFLTGAVAIHRAEGFPDGVALQVLHRQIREAQGATR